MLTMFVIKDLKNPNYGIPQFFRAPQDMRRHYATNILRDPEALAGLYPADYEVWAVGEWDETRGQLTVFPDMEFVCSMLEIHKIAQEAGAMRIPKEKSNAAR